NLAVLSGPSHAEEVARDQPTSLVVAAEDLALACWIQQRFSTERFRVYTNLDVAGVELAGALKNVMGIAAGIGDGLGFGDNAKSALMTRGLAEMARFGTHFGAEPATFAGLAGVGDLITTCVSPHGRNRRVGERLGGDRPPEPDDRPGPRSGAPRPPRHLLPGTRRRSHRPQGRPRLRRHWRETVPAGHDPEDLRRTGPTRRPGRAALHHRLAAAARR